MGREIVGHIINIEQLGDGAISVVLLIGEFLREAKSFIEDGVHPHNLIRSYRTVAFMDLEATLAPLNKSSEAAADDRPSATNGAGSSVLVTSLRTISSSNNISLQANVGN
ncbi:T-complex protein 1 subunit eta [Artemisia annua]|uniref:T-complex protein 1 subunit eta n=1 Tax=Artemisia annua TaxID=35608 RepID=A0A2U1P8Q7_ARTAN|nr:T-complex protein 1 subunit eta [Artemisia annua]